MTDQKDDWAAVLTPYTENGEPLWLKLDPERLKAGRSIWNLEVDLSEFETRLYEEGKFVRSFPVSIGMPTAPTPTGRFAITDTFRGGLNAAYGCCALATTARQVNLPSGWLGGDRIAFHGTSGDARRRDLTRVHPRRRTRTSRRWSTWSRRAPRSRSTSNPDLTWLYEVPGTSGLSRSFRFRTLPVAFRGSSSMKWTSRGTL